LAEGGQFAWVFQIITISQAGRKIISHVDSDSQIIVASFANERADGGQLIEPQNDVDFESGSDLKPTKKLSLPLNGKIYVTSDFGERFHPVFQKEIFHTGIDLRAEYEIVNSIANGIIVKESYDERAGNYMVIQHGNGIESIYCHLSKFLFRRGDLVFAGDGIAISGATGAVTAPHLHFAVKEDGRFVDPLPLLKAIVGYEKITVSYRNRHLTFE